MNSRQPLWDYDITWTMVDEEDCDDDSKCTNDGICSFGKCQCTVTWAGPNCTTHNHLYFHSFSLVFYGLMTVSFIQLFFCIRAEYIRQKKKSVFKACRITVQKFLYASTAVACLSRGLLFSLNDSSSIPEHFFKPALCTYYALITSSLALIVCYWCEIFFTEDAARGAAKRPRFLTKSRLAFTIFNSLLLGLLLIHFAASHFYEPISDQPPNMVFPALFATVLLIVHIMFLVVGVEIYCKIRGAFVSEKSEIANVDKVQAIHSRLGLFFQWGLTLFLIIFIICEVAGVPKIVSNVTFRSLYEITFRLLELGAILWFPCILWNCNNPEKLWALNPKKLLLPDSQMGHINETEVTLRDRCQDNVSKNDCWICYDPSHDSDLINPCKCKGDVAFVHHECLRRWLKAEENKKCSVCNYEYQITQDIMDFDSALKSIHWAMVVPSIVLILFIPYGTYLICRQAEKHDALKKQRTLIKSSAVIICLLIEYAVLRLIGMSGLRLYKTAANEAVKISSYTPNTNRSQEQVLIKSSRTGTRV